MHVCLFWPGQPPIRPTPRPTTPPHPPNKRTPLAVRVGSGAHRDDLPGVRRGGDFPPQLRHLGRPHAPRHTVRPISVSVSVSVTCGGGGGIVGGGEGFCQPVSQTVGQSASHFPPCVCVRRPTLTPTLTKPAPTIDQHFTPTYYLPTSPPPTHSFVYDPKAPYSQPASLYFGAGTGYERKQASKVSLAFGRRLGVALSDPISRQPVFRVCGDDRICTRL